MRIVKNECRLRANLFVERIFATCAALHNLRIKTEPWTYKTNLRKLYYTMYYNVLMKKNAILFIKIVKLYIILYICDIKRIEISIKITYI